MKNFFVTLTLVLAATFGLMIFSSPAVAQVAVKAAKPDADGVQEGTSQLKPIDKSRIRALVDFADDGTTLQVTGAATGMDPDKVYVSLIYDTGSVAKGADACLPTDNSLTFNQMILGFWLPVGSSTRTLSVVKAGEANLPTDYAPLNLIGTVSVREDTQPGPLPTAPDPNRFQLRACGKVRLERN